MNTKRAGLGKLILIPIVAVIVVCAMLLTNFFGLNSSLRVNAQDLNKGVSPSKVDIVDISSDFIKSSADFSIDMFKQSITEKKSSLVSPLSVYLALSMTANGSDGNTLKEFEQLLGKYGLTMGDINKYSYSLSNSLTDVKDGTLNIANSIWYKQDDGLKVNKDFLQTNADYYGASAYKADFSSPKTPDDINNWVKYNTGGLIDKIVDTINPDTMMYLINTVYFDYKWQDEYTKDDLHDDSFQLDDGTSITAKFMYSKEHTYLKDDNAEGFLKPYKDGKYSFMALLPNEGVSVDSYAASLTGEKFLSIIKNKDEGTVNTGLPKFKSEYTKGLVDPLKEMGLKDCFNEKADFSRMATLDNGKLFISDVLHKTYIQVDELGTKAGAVTKVEMTATSAPMEVKSVILNRPFVYAIIDNGTSLPIFIGTMHNPQ